MLIEHGVPVDIQDSVRNNSNIQPHFQVAPSCLILHIEELVVILKQICVYVCRRNTLHFIVQVGMDTLMQLYYLSRKGQILTAKMR